MAHVSARPPWLTDPMLAEMRRLRGSDTNHRERVLGPTSQHWWVIVLDEWTWLTPAGHAALNAIELEEINPLNADGTLKGEIQHVTLSSEVMSGLLHPEPVCTVTVEPSTLVTDLKALGEKFGDTVEAHVLKVDWEIFNEVLRIAIELAEASTKPKETP